MKVGLANESLESILSAYAADLNLLYDGIPIENGMELLRGIVVRYKGDWKWFRDSLLLARWC